MGEIAKYTKQVSIAGQDLTLSSTISDEHLDIVSHYVSKKLKAVRQKNYFSSNLRIGIYLGLQIADEYFVEKNELEAEIDALKTMIDIKVTDEIKNTIIKANKKQKQDIEKLNNHFISEITKLKTANNEQVINLESTINKLKKEKENLENVITIFNDEQKEKDKLIETMKKQHDEDLADYRVVFDEEIKELELVLEETKKLRIAEIEELKKHNFKKEEVVVRLVEENAIINEENRLLRKKIEELLKVNNELSGGEYFDDEFIEDIAIEKAINQAIVSETVENIEAKQKNNIEDVKEDIEEHIQEDINENKQPKKHIEMSSRFNKIRMNRRKGKR